MNQKAHITKTALSLFAAQGYGNTSVAQIAKQAGVSQGLMYNFFSSKDALLEAILAEGMSDIANSILEYQNGAAPKDALRAHIKNTFRIVSENNAYWRLFHSIRMQEPVRTLLGERYAAIQKEILHTLTATFRKLSYEHPKQEARIFFALIDGLVGHYLLDPSQFQLSLIQKTLFKKYQL
ncbi:MAG TPA: TetR/AcrR family transcriptional regulator [Chitinophagales bacterium]|nr:TetR/AcrR family transcriptional regulator [Chitinophagales bacterium]